MITTSSQITASQLFIALIFFALPLQALALTPSEVFERVKDSVFVVKTFDAKGKQKGLGSAVLLPTGCVMRAIVHEGAIRRGLVL